MCPDHQILSVYFDGELPSPWKEKMEQHLAACPLCRSRLDCYSALSTKLKAEEGDLTERRERVWGNLDRAHYRPVQPVFWRRSFQVPMPAAIAAAALIAIAGLFAMRAYMREPPETALMASFDGPENPEDIKQVFQYLEAQAAGGESVTIRLPESQRFTAAGAPTLIKAADYTGRINSR
jgi:hypothetical protein